MATIALTRVSAGQEVLAATPNNNCTTLESAINGGLDETNFAAGDIYTPNKIKQAAATSGQVLAWNGTDWAPATVAGALLAVTNYRAGADGAYSTTSTSFADVDAANLAITFTVPASGKVLITLTAMAEVEALNPNFGYWNLRESTSDISNSGGIVLGINYGTESGFNQITARVTHEVYLTGLAGTKTYKWGFKSNSTTKAHKIHTGPNNGPAVMKVFGVS